MIKPAAARTLEDRIRSHYEHAPDQPFYCRTESRTGENPGTFLAPEAVRERITEVMDMPVDSVEITEGSAVTERDPELHPTFTMEAYTERGSSGDLQPEEIERIVLRYLDSFSAGEQTQPEFPLVDEVRFIPPGTKFVITMPRNSKHTINMGFTEELTLQNLAIVLWYKCVLDGGL